MEIKSFKKLLNIHENIKFYLLCSKLRNATLLIDKYLLTAHKRSIKCKQRITLSGKIDDRKLIVTSGIILV